MVKIKVRLCESYTTKLFKDWVEIDSDLFDETKGMSKDELIDYINDNNREIKCSPNNKSNYIKTLYEELLNKKIIGDDIINENEWLDFDTEK